MKRKDLTLILVVVFVSVVISLVVSNLLITSPKNRQEKVEIVEPLTAEFKQPDKKYFNEKSIDPTLIIKIGNDNNQQPFNQ